jgi:alcohol dehydrogenase (cytochrome c)
MRDDQPARRGLLPLPSMPVRLILWACCCSLLSLVPMPASRAQAPATQAWYTAAQAEQGKQRYAQQCTWCHGARGAGETFGTPLIGERFAERWAGRTLEQLFEYVRTAMPPGKAGRLSGREYLDLLALILEFNGYPSGETALSFDALPGQVLFADREPAAPDASRTIAIRREVENFVPITEAMLLQPDPADWLMHSRTVDMQRFSPLDQINRDNVRDLRLAWVRGMEPGMQETIPVVYGGVMYVANPGDVIQALDATTGDLIWEYRRHLPDDVARLVESHEISRSLAVYADMVFHGTADGYIIALDARNGALRWETLAHDYRAGNKHSSGVIIADGKVLSGRACPQPQRCFIAAYDANTGRELWRRYTTAAPGEPGGDTWGDVPLERRGHVSPWGIPGSYDPVRRLVYWGVANPEPYPRIVRHGNPDAISRSSPADLYSNSTLALEVASGEIKWYYQHLPGDDWDEDHVHERILIDTVVAPDPEAVKWINPKVARGERRELLVTVGEPGGLWALDRQSGEFLWATPFPFDVPEFHISRIDVETGRTYLNWDRVAKAIGETHIVCFHNTKGYWPMAYSPLNNALYIPYNDFCMQQTANADTRTGTGPRLAIPRPGSDPDALAGIAKVDVATGRIERLHTQRVPSMGGALVTAGNVVFWGDLDRRVHAFDADSGETLWQSIVGDAVQNGPITYAVDGRQYVAVLTGWALSELLFLSPLPDIRIPAGHNAIYVFALPEDR